MILAALVLSTSSFAVTSDDGYLRDCKNNAFCQITAPCNTEGFKNWNDRNDPVVKISAILKVSFRLVTVQKQDENPASCTYTLIR